VNYFTKQLKIGKKTLQKLSKENNTNIKFGELLKYYLKYILLLILNQK
jgi:hypothetical protein